MTDQDLELAPWYKHLCEYYSVDPFRAQALGTRSDGRKPDLPGSPTCDPVSNMTFEDIWELRPRKTQGDIFDFYKDQGAWSSFRQVVRHKDMTVFHLNMVRNFLQPGMQILEYGCGVAPFSASLLTYLQDNVPLKIALSDVDCEHFSFGEWRLRRIIEERNLKAELSVKPIMPDKLPEYDGYLDLVINFEVMEHVPSPVATLTNLNEQLRPDGIMIENFIRHEGPDEDGPDLLSARRERVGYYDILRKDFTLLAGGDPDEKPNETRIWRKNDETKNDT